MNIRARHSIIKRFLFHCFLAGAVLPAATYGASADLSIPVHAHDPAQPGTFDYITYSFTIHNNSATNAAGGVTVTVSSTGSQFFDSGNPYFFVNNGDGTFTATIGTVAAGADAPFTVKYFAQTGAVSITATVSSTDDPNSSNNSATESTNAGGTTPIADVAVTSVVVTPNPGKIGDLRKYHGVITNNGPDTATAVQIGIQSDSVDGNGKPYDAFESFSSAVPAPSPAGVDSNGNRFLPLGDIPAQSSVSFDAFYDAVAQGSVSRNFFLKLSGTETDPNLDNNHLTVASSIDDVGSDTADLSMTLIAPSTVNVGSNITYQFHVLNSGPNTANGVMVSFLPSTHGKFVSATTPYTIQSGGPMDGYYLVQTPDLPIHVSSDFTFVFQALQAGPATLMGAVSSLVQDPNPDDNSFSATTTANVAPPPAHGGLSATNFTVNESTIAASNVVDTVLRFAATQTGTPAGLGVRVQYSTVPGNPESSWTDLKNGDSGTMIYDASSKQFVLSSLNYPAVNGVSFRAVASASGYQPDSISNKVGSFNLASSKGRLVPPILSVTGNGPFADLYFRAEIPTAISGVALRVQSSTTPFDELSWVDLNDGQSGHMLVSDDATRYYLLANNLPAVNGVFYRVLESLNGFADGISRPSGPFDITVDIPPTINSITVSKVISGSGVAVDPFVVASGSFTFTATATPGTGHNIKQLSLLYDGGTLADVANSSITQAYTTNVIGDHIVEAVAVDELGGASRFGTHAIYLRVIPATSAVKAESAPGESGSAAASVSSGKVYTLVTNNGLWSDAGSWKDGAGNNGVPGPNDMAVINQAKFVKLAQAVTVKSISLDGAIFNVNDIPAPQVSLTVTGMMTVSAHGGDLYNIHLIIDSGATCEFLNTEIYSLITGSVENNGKFNLHGSQGIQGLLVFANNGTSNFQVPMALPGDAGKNPVSDTRMIVAATVQTGGLIKSALTTGFLADGSALVGLVPNGVNKIVAQGGGNLVNTNGSNIVAQGGGNLVNTNGSNIVAQGGGNIVAQGGGNAPQGNGPADVTPTGFIQTGGETDMSGISITGSVTLNGGVLVGSGIIYGGLTNNGGYIAPGHSPGRLGVTGDFTQGAGGTLVIENGGATPDQFDQLQVAGMATLGGNLDLKLINGYAPDKADTFSPLSYSAQSGTFAAISANGTVTANSTGLLTTVDPATPGPDSGEARNVSTRAKVQTGENVEIGGFIVTGPPGSTKKVVLRGIGPSLTAAGVAGALADPYLELHQGATLLASNDNWKENQAAVEATGVAPTSDLESAIVATLDPGAYTVVLRGAHNETGVGLVEVYDLDATSAAVLANISTRCKVETGDDVMIGGFILLGGEPANVLVRAIGPSLTSAGVEGALSDPVLELHDANGEVITNNDWRETQEAEIMATTVPPADNQEAAILMTLPPGLYTAIVRGNDDGTGVGLVEVYNLK